MADLYKNFIIDENASNIVSLDESFFRDQEYDSLSNTFSQYGSNIPTGIRTTIQYSSSLESNFTDEGRAALFMELRSRVLTASIESVRVAYDKVLNDSSTDRHFWYKQSTDLGSNIGGNVNWNRWRRNFLVRDTGDYLIIYFRPYTPTGEDTVYYAYAAINKNKSTNNLLIRNVFEIDDTTKLNQARFPADVLIGYIPLLVDGNSIDLHLDVKPYYTSQINAASRTAIDELETDFTFDYNKYEDLVFYSTERTIVGLSVYTDDGFAFIANATETSAGGSTTTEFLYISDTLGDISISESLEVESVADGRLDYDNRISVTIDYYVIEISYDYIQSAPASITVDTIGNAHYLRQLDSLSGQIIDDLDITTIGNKVVAGAAYGPIIPFAIFTDRGALSERGVIALGNEPASIPASTSLYAQRSAPNAQSYIVMRSENEPDLAYGILISFSGNQAQIANKVLFEQADDGAWYAVLSTNPEADEYYAFLTNSDMSSFIGPIHETELVQSDPGAILYTRTETEPYFIEGGAKSFRDRDFLTTKVDKLLLPSDRSGWIQFKEKVYKRPIKTVKLFALGTNIQNLKFILTYNNAINEVIVPLTLYYLNQDGPFVHYITTYPVDIDESYVKGINSDTDVYGVKLRIEYPGGDSMVLNTIKLIVGLE